MDPEGLTLVQGWFSRREARLRFSGIQAWNEHQPVAGGCRTLVLRARDRAYRISEARLGGFGPYDEIRSVLVSMVFGHGGKQVAATT